MAFLLKGVLRLWGGCGASLRPKKLNGVRRARFAGADFADGDLRAARRAERPSSSVREERGEECEDWGEWRGGSSFVGDAYWDATGCEAGVRGRAPGKRRGCGEEGKGVWRLHLGRGGDVEGGAKEGWGRAF